MAASKGTSSSKAASAARQEVLDMLIEDHKGVRKLFREFEKLEKDNVEECESLVALTCAELKLHTQLEEECFYPAVRNALKEADLIDEAEVEHASAKQLIEQLEGLDVEDPKFAATFTVLGEYVKHHVKEEENELFPQLSKTQIDWAGIQQQMLERRMQLEIELGLSDEDGLSEDQDEDQLESDAQAQAGQASSAAAGEELVTEEDDELTEVANGSSAGSGERGSSKRSRS